MRDDWPCRFLTVHLSLGISPAVAVLLICSGRLLRVCAILYSLLCFYSFPYFSDHHVALFLLYLPVYFPIYTLSSNVHRLIDFCPFVTSAFESKTHVTRSMYRSYFEVINRKGDASNPSPESSTTHGVPILHDTHDTEYCLTMKEVAYTATFERHLQGRRNEDFCAMLSLCENIACQSICWLINTWRRVYCTWGYSCRSRRRSLAWEVVLVYLWCAKLVDAHPNLRKNQVRLSISRPYQIQSPYAV